MSIPVYSTEELATRIGDGSVDVTRLAATVAHLQETVAALVSWAQGQTAASASAPAPAPASASDSNAPADAPDTRKPRK